MKLSIWRAVVLGLSTLTAASAQNGLLRIDHYVKIKSAVPAIAGQSAQIYVREVVRADEALRSRPAADKVALFIHGAGTQIGRAHV